MAFRNGNIHAGMVFIWNSSSSLVAGNGNTPQWKAAEFSILVMHKFPILFFQEMVPFTSSLLKKPDTIAGIICGAVVTVITLTLVLGASQIIERIFPFMLGKEKNGI